MTESSSIGPVPGWRQGRLLQEYPFSEPTSQLVDVSSGQIHGQSFWCSIAEHPTHSYLQACPPKLSNTESCDITHHKMIVPILSKGIQRNSPILSLQAKQFPWSLLESQLNKDILLSVFKGFLQPISRSSRRLLQLHFINHVRLRTLAQSCQMSLIMEQRQEYDSRKEK